jgi:hypothetical protein
MAGIVRSSARSTFLDGSTAPVSAAVEGTAGRPRRNRLTKPMYLGRRRADLIVFILVLVSR